MTVDFLLHLIREAYPFRQNLKNIINYVVQYLLIVVVNKKVQIKDYQKKQAEDILEWIGPESNNNFMKAMGIVNKETLVRTAKEYFQRNDIFNASESDRNDLDDMVRILTTN